METVSSGQSCLTSGPGMALSEESGTRPEMAAEGYQWPEACQCFIIRQDALANQSNLQSYEI